jgi:iron complex transport system ATP-binding protein
MTVLSAEEVSVVLGPGVRVLKSVSLAPAPGEVTGLIGPNGAGKTTLLNAMAGLLEPEQGRVLYDGQPLKDISRQQRGREIAYLEQDTQCHWPLTVERMVMLGRTPYLRPFRGESAEDHARVADAMTQCDVVQFAERNVLTLSGGERARAMLSRALTVEPKVLLADEPTAGLDPYHQLHVMELLRERAQAGTAIVVVLHDLTLAARFCDRVCVLSEGEVAADGTPADVFAGDVVPNVYGVTTSTGTHDGQTYVIPWRRLPPKGLSD